MDYFLQSKGLYRRCSTNDDQIALCQDIHAARDHFQDAFIHELVHAYDWCRAEIDPTNCEHLACTEVRATFKIFDLNPSRYELPISVENASMYEKYRVGILFDGEISNRFVSNEEQSYHYQAIQLANILLSKQ